MRIAVLAACILSVFPAAALFPAGASVKATSPTATAGGKGPGLHASAQLPEWVEALPLWRWHEIPGTALSSVDPTVRRLGVTGPRSKIDAWCGATLKREGSVYMLGAAGGHADYAGNEVDALRLNAERPRWVELRPASRNEDIVSDTQFYLDRRPSATHTYYATQFIDSLDRMVVFPSAGVNGLIFPKTPAGFPYTGDKRSFSFNVVAGDWDPPDFIASYPGRGDYIAALVAKNPVTGDVYYSRNGGDGFYKWSAAANSWTKLSGMTRSPWYAGAAIDPTRKRMLVVGGYSPAAPAVISLDGLPLPATFGGLGASVLTLGGYPGVIYDEANDGYLVLYNDPHGKISVLRVNAETWLVDEPPITGAAPARRANGIQNSVQYAPELKGFVIANRYDGDVYFIRTAR